ncbi:MAG: antiholin [Pelagibacteraceae bacterium BACL5 MAG-120705-bin12]|jgi:holin-like protein|nr:MAG: antiholin [Pelagibacteraceae bacterium BACL5 MAG-121015-bin10]KRO59720.1 MAG: antiholin [Pelagibacteraceae bacterium BACL5 MAG-121128-bin54]KRO59726.1 MAG: antiholin [Pelagibacteraceae bacterium BACL5 MAG-120705-bin12]KRO65180.1 MAG: antiholin [Pelagibacteraceae bacterium BACL5 MAG-120820-bin39]MDA1166976.1 CidA/LrgA family protein [Pseudomonadota bacterium]
MLRSLFIIFFFQLLGEAIQKFFEINIPGPVIGLILLLLVFIFFIKNASPFRKIKKEISETSHQIINYLSLLFVPIGVGVVMHINYLGDNLFKILAIIIIGTLSTLVFVAYVMEKIINLEKNNAKRR